MFALKPELDSCRREQVEVTIFFNSFRFEGKIVELNDEFVVLGKDRERRFILLDRIDALAHE